MSDRGNHPPGDDRPLADVPHVEGPEPAPTTGAPRWAKVFGIIALVVVVLFVILLLAGGGEHGPGRHMPSNGRKGDAPPSSVAAHMPFGGDHAPS